MKQKIISLMKRAVKGYCEAASMMYPTGVIPMKRF